MNGNWQKMQQCSAQNWKNRKQFYHSKTQTIHSESCFMVTPFPLWNFCAYKNEMWQNTIGFTASQKWTHQLKRQQYCYDTWTCSVICLLDRASLWQLKNKKPTRCHLLFYCTSYRLNMFRALLCPSSGARDYDVDYHIGRFVLGLLYVGG